MYNCMDIQMKMSLFAAKRSALDIRFKPVSQLFQLLLLIGAKMQLLTNTEYTSNKKGSEKD